MATEQDQDRSEAATPFKLAEARKKGQVARSADVVSAVVFCAAAMTLYFQGQQLLLRLFRLSRELLSLAATPMPPGGMGLAHLALKMTMDGLALCAGPFATLLITAIVVNVAQTGPVFSLKALAPDWERLNPVNGVKRVFSMRTLFDALRSLLKLLVLSAVAWSSVNHLLPGLAQLGGSTPLGVARALVADAASLGLAMAVGLVAIAAVDLVFTRRDFAKKMRMSRREVREEAKNREGDPRIRSRLRELRREMLKRSRAAQRTRQADLLVTNPTHYAVALAYRHGQMSAPRIVAKGSGALALVMRRIAHRHAIPIVPRPILARALFAATEPDDALPEPFYREVALLMTWVLAMRSRAAPVGAGA